jgi:ribosomal-protein-alanine N-acetyltransferase
MLHLRKERLTLVAATLELVRAEAHGPQKLGALLGAHVPPLWPPPLNDATTLAWTTKALETDPAGAGWFAWYFMHREHGRLEAVGVGGFAGRPSADGTVEVGYSILPSHHRLGFAPEAVRALADWAFTHGEVARVVARTLPALMPSIRVLEKCGFTRAPAAEGEVCFELTREAHGRAAGMRRGR